MEPVRCGGFTLLEMLVVIALLGLLTGVALPRLNTLYTRWQAAYQRDEVLSQLSGLSYRAFREGRTFTLTTYPAPQAPPLELPSGWQVQAEKPILFRSNGVCSGGKVTLTYQNETYHASLIPPACRTALL